VDEPIFYRPDEVAERLRLSRSKTYAAIQSGEIPSVRIGRSVRVPRAALERWVESRLSAARPAA